MLLVEALVLLEGSASKILRLEVPQLAFYIELSTCWATRCVVTLLFKTERHKALCLFGDVRILGLTINWTF